MSSLISFVIQQVVIYFQGLIGEDEEIVIIIRKIGKPQIMKRPNRISYRPEKEQLSMNVQEYILDLKDFKMLDHPESINLEAFRKQLMNSLKGCHIARVMVKGQVEGLAFEWDDVSISIVGIENENLQGNRRVSVAYGILEVITLKPDWMVKCEPKTKMEKRLLFGFDKYQRAIFEGKDASYVIKGDGMNYRGITENLWHFRKKKDVVPVDHKGANWKVRLVDALTN